MIEKFQHCIRSITDTEMIINFSDYFVMKPTVLVTMMSGVTDVDIDLTPELVTGVGEVYAKVTLVFSSGDIGKEFNFLVIGV